ncbi:hypothetical protein C8Q77DRAFT_670197 [Trametes polyzona]|nr:hypothetical protein C8Q77DRAFT_670197 [Trametes polyzona]
MMLHTSVFGRDHFAPHSSCGFEGYYTRTQTEDGGTIAVIFCWVRRAKHRGSLVFVLYEPPPDRTSLGLEAEASPSTDRDPTAPSSGRLRALKYQFFPERFDVVVGEHVPGEPQAFTITAPGLGSMKVSGSTIEYDIHVPEPNGLRLHLVLTSPKPWSRTHPLSGPMGPLLHISRLLPLNWHVRSPHSTASYTLARANAGAGAATRGTGRAHVEKNWGAAFPSGWLWSQAFSADADGARTLCLAGGAALPGVPLQAYLVGYRSPRRACAEWDFRPPFALALGRGMGGLSPFMRVRRDSRRGEVELRVETWFRRLEVRIAAPPESFVGVTAPLKDGHEMDYAYESFRATVEVVAYARSWPWQDWKVVDEATLGTNADGVACGALEFGGSFCHLVGA